MLLLNRVIQTGDVFMENQPTNQPSNQPSNQPNQANNNKSDDLPGTSRDPAGNKITGDKPAQSRGRRDESPNRSGSDRRSPESDSQKRS